MEVWFVILFIIFTHYIFPLIHYCCIGACCKRTRRSEQYHTNVASIDVDSQYAVSEEESRAIFKTEKSISRVLSMHFTFWTYAWIIFLAAMVAVVWEDEEPTYMFVLKIFGYIHLPLFILFLWIETFLSWEYQYLNFMLEEKTCKAYIQELIEQQPVVTLSVVAYHYETRTRTVQTTGPDGQTRYETETYQEKVIDHTEVEQFPFSRWQDLSPSPDTLNLNAGKVTRVRLLKQIILGDNQTETEFSRLRSEMEEKVRMMFPCSILEFGRHDGISGYVSRLCAYWETDTERWWTNKWLYITMSVLLLTWVYRIAFTFATQSTCFRLVKTIYSF